MQNHFAKCVGAGSVPRQAGLEPEDISGEDDVRAMRYGLALGAGLLALLVAGAATAGAGNGNGYGRDGVKFVPPNLKVPHGKKAVQQLLADAKAAGLDDVAALDAVSKTPPIGTVRTLAATNFVTGGIFGTSASLRGVGEKIEVWVQNTRTFPAGDCRNTNPADLAITDEQVNQLIQAFDEDMFPVESDLFSTPPDRDGSNPQVGLDFTGDGDKILTLVMNIRDENYFDTNNANGLSYVVGYFSPGITELMDRNVMTIDAFDWIHRTGASPPNDPVSGPAQACTSRPAFPYRMESTFAHEYQHLLENYASPGEVSWVNEGLSDYAMRKTGFASPEIPAGQIGADGHIQCFYGNLGVTLGGVPLGGPENSLTWWGDQPNEGLCDYGAAWTMMEYLEGQFGQAFMSALHNEDRDGLDGLQAVLDRFLTGRNAQDVVHDWLASVALDDVLDATSLRGSARDERYQVPTLAAAINWDTLEAFSSAGAPPNGADYVRLRDGGGAYLNAEQMGSLSFAGQRQFAPDPVAWKVVDGALSADLTDDLRNTTIGREVTVPAADPTLTFKGKYDLEEHWDYGFVQVCTDGGATYTSIACTNTNSDNVPNAHPLVLQYVPGYSGVQATFRTETCNLSAYAGKTVILLFRGVTDWGTVGNDDETANDGWFVDDITLGGTLLSDGTSLAGWRSETEIVPVKIAGWTIQLVGYRSDNTSPAVLARVPVAADFTTSLDKGKLRRLIGDDADVVAALVSYDEPSEAVEKYARYELRVNGTLQPGG
jgi:hypothetical protein